MYSNLNDIASSYFNLMNNKVATIGNASISSNNTTSTSNFDFKQNGVILDIKNNNEQIFINGIKLGSILPKINETSKKPIVATINENATTTLEATSIINPTSVALIVDTTNSVSSNTAATLLRASSNKLPKLEQNTAQPLLPPAISATHSFALIKPSYTSNNSTNSLNVNSNNYSFQSDLKPISFKLPAASNITTTSNESYFENTNRISKLIKKSIYKEQEKVKPNIIIENRGITYEEPNPVSLLRNENKYYEHHFSQSQNITVNKIGKNASNTNQKEDEPKDKRFRRKLIPITDAVKQPKPKKLSVEFTKPKVVPEETNTSSHFNENSTNSFHILQNDSFVSFQSSNNIISVPLPVSQITIRTMPKVDTSKPLVSKLKTPRGSFSEQQRIDLKPPSHGRWSPIKITPMKSQKLFEKLRIEDYDTDKLKELTDKFKELDTDDDGHLEFHSIENHYCQNFKPQQKSFIYQLYQALSEPSYFGLKEFFSLALVIEQFKKLDTRKLDNYWDHFNQTDFEDYKDDIKDFIKLIDVNDLRGVLRVGDVIKSRNRNFDSDKFFKNSRHQINNILNQLKYFIEGYDLPSKLSNYVLLIPLYIYLECLIKNKSIITKRTSKSSKK